MGYLIKRGKEILKQDGLWNLVRKLLFFPFQLVNIVYCLLILKKMKTGKSAEELVDFAFNGCHGLIHPFQVKQEILILAKILEQRRPNSVLEIGTASGGTLFIFCRLAQAMASIVSIDVPAGQFGGGYHYWKAPLYRAFVCGQQKIHLLQTDSHLDSTIKKVETLLGKQAIDFLHIDGDHTYEGVKKDFQMYSRLVRKGGLIVIHDITVNPPEPGCQVNRFWEEVKTTYNYKEIIQDSQQNGAGIGIIFYE
jgi:predicted O-methyltransferase YrrM